MKKLDEVTEDKVTPRGKAHLKQETATWVRYTETVTGILTGAQEA